MILTHFSQLLCTLYFVNMKKLLSSFLIGGLGIVAFAVPVFASSQSSVSVHVSSNGVSQTRTYTSQNSGVHVYASASDGQAIISIAPQEYGTVSVSSNPTSTPTQIPMPTSDASVTPTPPIPTPSIDWDLKSKETLAAFVAEVNHENDNIVGWIREWLEKHNFSRKTFFTFMRGENEVPPG